MTSLIEEKIKEFMEEFDDRNMLEGEDGIPLTIMSEDAKDFLRQALTEVQEAQKQSYVAVLEGMKVKEREHNAHDYEKDYNFNRALDEAINKIQG